MDSVPRSLNDYECMLATSTVNFALRFTVSKCTSEALGDAVRRAWAETVNQYALLRCALRATGEMGPLGPRYSLEVRDPGELEPIEVSESDLFCGDELVRELQRAGTTRLSAEGTTYAASCALTENAEPVSASASMVFALSHAVCDGRGAMFIAHAFLDNLRACIDGLLENGAVEEEVPAIDLQARILGSDYSKDADPFPNEIVYPELVGTQGIPEDSLQAEMKQNLPRGDAQTKVGTIDCVHVTLDSSTTMRLLARLRAAGATVQGALGIAWILTRYSVLGLDNPISAALLTPADARGEHANGNIPLCGSAGLWHVQAMKDTLLASATDCTKNVRAAAQRGQHREWLRRLFHEPGTLPPHSLIMSSVGVSPVQAEYGGIKVHECMFFGGAHQGAQAADRQGTMVHAVTFNGCLQMMCNYTSPGVSREFMVKTSCVLREVLTAMADVEIDQDVPTKKFLSADSKS